MFENWKEKKKIKKLEKVIDKLTKVVEQFTKDEKYWRDEAARDLEWARSCEEGNPKLLVLNMKERAERHADSIAKYMPPLLEELARVESLRKRKIEALQDRALTTKQETSRFFFYCY